MDQVDSVLGISVADLWSSVFFVFLIKKKVSLLNSLELKIIAMLKIGS